LSKCFLGFGWCDGGFLWLDGVVLWFRIKGEALPWDVESCHDGKSLKVRGGGEMQVREEGETMLRDRYRFSL
jgi:hypothetical protein